MADKPAKRLVKNPETFRERAIKATELDDKPSKRGRVKRAVGTVIKPVTTPVGRGARAIAGHKAVKPMRKPVRILGKIIIPPYFRNSWKELRLVHWPSWKESRRLTYAVLIFAIIFGASIALLDFGLDKLFRNILLK